MLYAAALWGNLAVLKSLVQHGVVLPMELWFETAGGADEAAADAIPIHIGDNADLARWFLQQPLAARDHQHIALSPDALLTRACTLATERGRVRVLHVLLAEAGARMSKSSIMEAARWVTWLSSG